MPCLTVTLTLTIRVPYTDVHRHHCTTPLAARVRKRAMALTASGGPVMPIPCIVRPKQASSHTGVHRHLCTAPLAVWCSPLGPRVRKRGGGIGLACDSSTLIALVRDLMPCTSLKTAGRMRSTRTARDAIGGLSRPNPAFHCTAQRRHTAGGFQLPHTAPECSHCHRWTLIACDAIGGLSRPNPAGP